MQPSRVLMVRAQTGCIAATGEGDTLACKTFIGVPMLFTAGDEDTEDATLNAITGGEKLVINQSRSAIEVGDIVQAVQEVGGFWIVQEAGGGGSALGGTIEFEIIDPSSSASASGVTPSSSIDDELCENQVYDAPSTVTAMVVRRPCGVSRVYGEDEAGHVEVHDSLQSFLFERSADEIIGKRGFATLMSAPVVDSASSASPSSSAAGDCEWVITWIDWFQWTRVQSNTVVGTDRITFSYKNVKVWDQCKLADEVVIGADCDPASSTSSVV